MEEQGRAAGYDPNLDSCLLTEDLLSALAELQEAMRHWPEDSPPSPVGLGQSGACGTDGPLLPRPQPQVLVPTAAWLCTC